jgi:hypothetical protein
VRRSSADIAFALEREETGGLRRIRVDERHTGTAWNGSSPSNRSALYVSHAVAVGATVSLDRFWYPSKPLESQSGSISGVERSNPCVLDFAAKQRSLRAAIPHRGPDWVVYAIWMKVSKGGARIVWNRREAGAQPDADTTLWGIINLWVLYMYRESDVCFLAMTSVKCCSEWRRMAKTLWVPTFSRIWRV